MQVVKILYKYFKNTMKLFVDIVQNFKIIVKLVDYFYNYMIKLVRSVLVFCSLNETYYLHSLSLPFLKVYSACQKIVRTKVAMFCKDPVEI